ncbi:MAG: ferritin-like domain-containing protein [Deltaproteobacteria bacterium]|nr:ferritin-like domain-containing protein [Deltaproteobacteria bacterium]
MKSQTEHLTRPGDNHTGLGPHPELLAEMLEGVHEFGPTSGGGPDAIAHHRIRVAHRSQPVATMPPATDVPLERLPILDKLGARLAFERMGTRLYDALISKLDAYGTFPGGPTRENLVEIRDQEHRHMMLALEVISALGGDPTAVTPCANLQATASKGIADVLMDPRTNLVECLDAIIVAELTDVESWTQLASVMVGLDDGRFLAGIRAAEQTEHAHLEKVRSWIAAGTGRASIRS